MRWQAIVGGAALAIVLVASSAGAHVGAVDVETSNEQTPEAACVPLCEVQTTRLGNAPPVTVVESGETVTWTIAEGSYHTVISDDGGQDKRTTVVQGSGAGVDGCLHLQVFGPSSAEFRIQDDQLQALDLGEDDPEWQTCEEAVAMGGGFLLSYHCGIHPRFQNSALLVVPST